MDTDVTDHIMWYPGQKINNFEIRFVLGEGAFGRVLQVRSTDSGHLAALKVIKNMPNKSDAAMAEVNVLTTIASLDPRSESFCVELLSWFHYGGHLCIAFPLLSVSVFDFFNRRIAAHFIPAVFSCVISTSERTYTRGPQAGEYAVRELKFHNGVLRRAEFGPKTLEVYGYST